MIATINKSKVAIFSDLHLGVHSNSTEWHKYAIEWANWFRDECREKGIKDIIFCGDIYRVSVYARCYEINSLK